MKTKIGSECLWIRGNPNMKFMYKSPQNASGIGNGAYKLVS